MEITRKNFADELNNITKNLKRSCFIAFDAEFTALLSGEKFKYRLFSLSVSIMDGRIKHDNCLCMECGKKKVPEIVLQSGLGTDIEKTGIPLFKEMPKEVQRYKLRLFDTNEERYNQLKNEVDKMIMTQVGLTMFQYERDLDMYVAVSYTFHLRPQAFGDIDQSFIFQASTLNFLCRHNFNFNNFIYEGIPYLSKEEEEKVREQLKDRSLFNNLTRMLELEDERHVQNFCSMVSKWLIANEEETMYLDVESPVLRYIVHNEVRLRFPDVLTTDSLGNSKKILIYRDKHVEGANSAPMAILEDNLMSHLLGFSQIISLLAFEKKPIIGHNLFLDTILLHRQFLGPLPKSYSLFKNNINNIFPIIFDTKYISHEQKYKLSFDAAWKSNALQDLYEFFSEGKCKELEHGVNLIRLSTPFDVKQSYHEAGWDSYCSGYCFIRLGHWAACEISGKYRPVGPREKIAALTPHCNKINIIRGAVPYMNLVGHDPPVNRPSLLHVKSLKEKVINIGKVASVLAECGSLDIKPYGSRTALIATGTFKTAKDILKKFKDSNEYSISMFSVYRHSPISRIALWSGAILTGSLVLYFVHKKAK